MILGQVFQESVNAILTLCGCLAKSSALRLLLDRKVENLNFEESSLKGSKLSDELEIFFGRTPAIIERFDELLQLG